MLSRLPPADKGVLMAAYEGGGLMGIDVTQGQGHNPAADRALMADALPLPLFTWEAFKWAMAVVVTRQNKVPTAEGVSSNHGEYDGELALTPVFDMLNHEAGRVLSDYAWAGPTTKAETSATTTLNAATGNATAGALILYAKRAYAKGEQLQMSYGARSKFSTRTAQAESPTLSLTRHCINTSNSCCNHVSFML